MFLPRHQGRCDTLPGLTGLWQVSGKNRTTFERMMELDLAYVEKKSLLLDVKILLWTAPAVVIQVMDTKAARMAAATTLAMQKAGLGAIGNLRNIPVTTPARVPTPSLLRGVVQPTIG
jgi:hypothetical protein